MTTASVTSLRRLAPARLLPSIFAERHGLNRTYLAELRTQRLLQNFHLEAGLQAPMALDDLHGGWELPTSLVRGHFTGHWLSAAAQVAAATGDAELRGKAEWAVAELARCQREAGGEWLSSIPPTYLERAARGQPTWAAQYVVEKTLSGLLDAHLLLGSEQALDVLERMADWMHRWTGQRSAADMAALVDLECGHMMGVWAGLFAVTGKPRDRELMERYYRRSQFDALVAGRDVLSNRHANTSIPEACGVARAYEATGEDHYRAAALAYWRCAVEEREQWVTGGQSAGEFWVPPGRLPVRMGITTQEHCMVYNMRRLAEHLLRWTGDPTYADYRERTLWNGILAQQHRVTGMVCYYLPMRPGATKDWGTRTESFFCCHGSLVQAHSLHGTQTWYEDDDGLVLAEYVPTRLDWRRDGVAVTVTLEEVVGASAAPDGSGRVDVSQDVGVGRPDSATYRITVAAERPVDFTLRIRVPWWVAGDAEIGVAGERPRAGAASSFLPLARSWQHDTVTVRLPRRLVAEPLAGRPGTVAFIDGPVALAGLCDEEVRLRGDVDDPGSFLALDDEREWDRWNTRYRTVGQERSIRLVPLHEITDERYSVYFPVDHEKVT